MITQQKLNDLKLLLKYSAQKWDYDAYGKIFTDDPDSPLGTLDRGVGCPVDAELTVELHNAAPDLIKAAEELIELKWIVTQILNSLPQKRDWLDPVLESQMRMTTPLQNDTKRIN